MKKFTRVLALAMVAVLCVAMLASCGGPATDPAKAVEALKGNDYVAAEDKLIVPAALRLIGVKDIDAVVSGTKTTDEKFDTITIIYFASKDAASDAWDAVKGYAEKNKDSKASNWVCEKSGALIYFGTKDAVKAAK